MLGWKTFRVWFSATLLMGAPSLSAKACTAQEKQNAIREIGGTYRVCIGDHLDISVWQHSKLSKTVVVDRHGNIRLPSINVVKASGLSVNALEDLLTRKLEFIFPKPFVSVIVSGTNCLFEGPPPVPELQMNDLFPAALADLVVLRSSNFRRA
jgi:protein involved in polysaccharide export with SLBB domain